MKRKVLQAGRSSLSVSLPKKFVDNHGIEAGDEIEVNHEGTLLSVSYDDPGQPPKKIDVPVADVENKERFYYELIGALFMQGANTFTLHVETDEQISTIRSILQKGRLNIYEKSCQGHKLVLHTPATKFDKDALHDLIDRVIKHLYQSIDSLQEHMQEGKIEDAVVEQMEEQDTVVNDKVDICRRIINQHLSGYEATTLYNFTDKLDRIGDEIKFLSRQASNADLSEQVPYVQEIKDSLFTLQRAHRSFSVDRLAEFDSLYGDLIEHVRDDTGDHCIATTLKLIRDGLADLLAHNV